MRKSSEPVDDPLVRFGVADEILEYLCLILRGFLHKPLHQLHAPRLVVGRFRVFQRKVEKHPFDQSQASVDAGFHALHASARELCRI